MTKPTLNGCQAYMLYEFEWVNLLFIVSVKLKNIYVAYEAYTWIACTDTQLYIENDVCLWFINEFSFIFKRKICWHCVWMWI